MSNLLEQASLVLIPSGYKEDVVYSEIPIDGAGDMSFTRASNGTRINSQGLVEVCPWNLCDYSEDQNQWSSQNQTTVTANSTTAPNGTLTADTVTPTATNDDHYRGIGLSSQVGALTAFIYVKPNGYNFFDWGIWNGSQYLVRATFDLVNLTYTFTDAGTATIESVGNGWLKCGISGTNASLSPINLYYRSRPTGGTGAFTGDGTSGAFIWGAQLNIGSTAKPYFPTTDLLNVPRLTYQNGGGGCPSLLLEKQSTNLFTYSEQFDNAAWTKSSGSVTANQAISPDGTQNADLLVGEMYQQPTFTNATTYSFSVFAKKESGSTIYIGYIDNVTGFVGGSITYTYSTGVVAVQQSANGSVSGQAIDMGNGWIRVIIKYTTIASVTFNYQYIGSTGSYVWGAQTEVSSYPTSYIPTTSSTATRVADVANKSSISSLFGASATSFFMDFEITQVSSDATWTVTGYDGSNLFSLCQFGAITNFPRIVFDGGVDTTLGTALSIGRHKIAVSFATNDFRAYIDGALVLTDTSCTYNRYDRIAVNGTAWTGNTNNNNSFKLNEYAQFPNVLTNAELASLTTI
jgi:hypothetical protein